MNRLSEFRKTKDDFFARYHDSPLTDEQKRSFKGLKYFPENPALRLEVEVQEFPVKDKIRMQTPPAMSRSTSALVASTSTRKGNRPN